MTSIIGPSRGPSQGPHPAIFLAVPERSLAAFLRWTDHLPRLRGAPELAIEARLALWRRAAREIAARTALALAREGHLAARLEGASLRLDLRRGHLTLPLARRGQLGLHTADLDAPREPALDHPDALITSLTEDLRLDPATHARLAFELRDSAFNLALIHHSALLREITRGGARPCLSLDPENLVISGHPWHPMTRARLGLSACQVLRHAPEHLACGDLSFLDVRADHLTLSGDARDILHDLSPPAPPSLVRIPVHPVQLRRLRRRFAALWGEVIKDAPIPARPARSLLSLRTVALTDPARPYHIKLALDVVTTSARRTVSPMSVANGPPLTALLERIQARDHHTATLAIQGDRGGAGLSGARYGEDAAHLGVILRGDPRPLARALAPADHRGAPVDLWVCAALGERSPGATSTFLQQLAASLDPRRFLRRYLDLLLPPALRLLTAHGVALEAHLQNTVAVRVDGQLVGFLIRDLGGLRVDRARLARAGHHMSFEPGSFIITDDHLEVRDKLVHALFHAHLAELFRWVERDLGVDAAESWSLARRLLDRLYSEWRREPALTAACDDDHAALIAPVVRAKALLTMRLTDRSSDYSYIRVDNPLAGAR